MRAMRFDGSVSLTACVRGAVAGMMALTMIASGGAVVAAESRTFITSDGARLHYLEAGPPSARTVVLVPGWTMPAWIWERQIEALQDRFHVLALDPQAWPAVDIVTSHAGARGATLEALVAAGARGIVLAGTGNGSVHAVLLAAAHRALAQGVMVRRASRCLLGGVVGEPDDALPSAGSCTPAQARVMMMLELTTAAPPSLR